MAIKRIDKNHISFDAEFMAAELKLLSELDHANIIKYFESYNDEEEFFIVTEYVNGCELD